MSNFGSLNWADIGKGALIAALTTLFGLLGTVAQGATNGAITLPTLAQVGQWLLVSLAAGVAYIAKNFVTNSQNQLLTKEEPKP